MAASETPGGTADINLTQYREHQNLHYLTLATERYRASDDYSKAVQLYLEGIDTTMNQGLATGGFATDQLVRKLLDTLEESGNELTAEEVRESPVSGVQETLDGITEDEDHIDVIGQPEFYSQATLEKVNENASGLGRKMLLEAMKTVEERRSNNIDLSFELKMDFQSYRDGQRGIVEQASSFEDLTSPAYDRHFNDGLQQEMDILWEDHDEDELEQALENYQEWLARFRKVPL